MSTNGRTRDYDTCGALSDRTGLPCEAAAGAGTSHLGSGRCSHHGGSSPAHTARGNVAKANSHLVSLGQSINIHPIEALSSLLSEAWGNVAFYRARLSELGVELFSIDKYTHVETTRAVVHMYNAERDRAAKIAKMCIDVGLSDRVVRLQEQQSQAIVSIVYALIEGLSLTQNDALLARKIASSEIRRLASSTSSASSTSPINGLNPSVITVEGTTRDRAPQDEVRDVG